MANNFRNSFSQGVGTSPTIIYTATNVQATVIGMTVANILNTNITANVIVRSGSTDYYVVKNATIESGSSLIPYGGEQKLVLENGDYIQVSSSDSSSVDVIISVLEIS
jgi:hypothetical protein